MPKCKPAEFFRRLPNKPPERSVLKTAKLLPRPAEKIGSSSARRENRLVLGLTEKNRLVREE